MGGLPKVNFVESAEVYMVEKRRRAASDSSLTNTRIGKRAVNNSFKLLLLNALEVDSEEENEEVEDGEETNWDSTWSEGMVDGDDDSVSQDDYDSNDTEYNYPYDLQNMKKSIPLHGPVMINGQVVQAIFDLGTFVSIISQSLVDKLNLVLSSDKLAVSTIDENSNCACEVVKDVLIRVAGKLRPGHMCIESSGKHDLCLLSTT